MRNKAHGKAIELWSYRAYNSLIEHTPPIYLSIISINPREISLFLPVSQGGLSGEGGRGTWPVH